MTPALFILTLSWGIEGICRESLGAAVFVENSFAGSSFPMWLLPPILYLLGAIVSFATGTSWGTFGILIPIVNDVFAEDPTLLIIGMSACLAGAVCGDHCSPISATTIMSSAGAQCDHLNHVSTQIPYAVTVAAVSFIGFLLAGLVQNWFIVFPITVAILFAVLIFIKMRSKKKA